MAKQKKGAAPDTEKRGSLTTDRAPLTIRLRSDVRKKIKVLAAQNDVLPSDVIDALVDQFADRIDWGRAGRR